jgi:hypothetical protein
MFLKDVLDDGDLREGDVELANVLQDLIDFGDDFLASADGVVVRFMKVVGSRIQKLNKAVGGQFRNDVVGVFLGDVELIVLH